MDFSSPDDLTEIGRVNDAVQPDSTQRPHGSAWLAWIVIIATIGYMLVPHFGRGNGETAEPSIVLFEIQARYLVGAASLTFMGKESSEDQIQAVFGNGALRQRLICAVVQGELIGPDKAAKTLSELQTRIENGSMKSTTSDREVVRVLQHIQTALLEKQALEQGLSAEVWQADRSLVLERLGWVGRLALSPPGGSDHQTRAALLDHARRTLFVILGVFGLAVMASSCSQSPPISAIFRSSAARS